MEKYQHAFGQTASPTHRHGLYWLRASMHAAIIRATGHCRPAPWRIRRALSASVAGWVCISFGAAAEERIDASAVEVLASPMTALVTADHYSGTSTLVSESEMRELGAVDPASALGFTSGVQVTRPNLAGNFGGERGSTITIRGMGASRPGSEIKPYIDGIPFYQAVFNDPMIDLLPVNGMQSITVYKSPQPQISGNNFASINLFTKRALADGIHGNATAMYGSYDTWTEQADIYGRRDDVEFLFAQNHARSNGHRPDADGHQSSAIGRIALHLNEHWTTGFNVVLARSLAHDPGDMRLPKNPITTRYESTGMLGSLFVEHQHEGWRGETKVYHTTGEGNLLDQPPTPGVPANGDILTDFSTQGLRWKEVMMPWEGVEITAGLDYDRLNGRLAIEHSTPPFSPNRTHLPTSTIFSPYLAVNRTFHVADDWDLTPSVGMRHYRHNRFGSINAPHAGMRLDSKRLSVFAHASRGVNFPSLEVPALQFMVPMLDKQARPAQHRKPCGTWNLAWSTR